jgi:hypothetical protein
MAKNTAAADATPATDTTATDTTTATTDTAAADATPATDTTATDTTTATTDTAAADATPAEAPGTIEAFVLCDCSFGKCGEVVLLNDDQIANGLATGVIDTTPAAVENAKAQ